MLRGCPLSVGSRCDRYGLQGCQLDPVKKNN